MPDRVPDYVRRAEASASRRRGEFVGFLACSHRGGRLLKVALPDQRQRVRVTCPVDGCPEGEHATGNAMPRPRLRGEVCDVSIDGAPVAAAADDGQEPDAAELEAIEAEDNTTPTPAADAPRWRHSDDAAILAAVPTGRTPAHVVAKELGYGTTNPLVRRLERINERATAAGKDAPVILAKRGAGHRVEVRRAVTMEGE